MDVIQFKNITINPKTMRGVATVMFGFACYTVEMVDEQYELTRFFNCSQPDNAIMWLEGADADDLDWANDTRIKIVIPPRTDKPR